MKQEKRAMSDQFLFQQFSQQQKIEKEAKGSSVEEEAEEIQRYSAYNFSSFLLEVLFKMKNDTTLLLFDTDIWWQKLLRLIRNLNLPSFFICLPFF